MLIYVSIRLTGHDLKSFVYTVQLIPLVDDVHVASKPSRAWEKSLLKRR